MHRNCLQNWNRTWYYITRSLNRESSAIIREQQQNVRDQNETSIEAMHAAENTEQDDDGGH